jgi:hypothetical protein
VREDVTISYRGASYEIGRGPGFYGIWAAVAPRSQPAQWWPETPEGWSAAWSRFTQIEAPGTIVAVGRTSAASSWRAAWWSAAGQPAAGPPAGPPAAPVPAGSRRAVIPAALLAVGVACGIAGLFPAYLAGASLAQEPAELVPHAVYLAVWGASALLIGLGGARLRVGTLLATGMTVVAFGFFFADAGQVIAGGAHLIGAGLVLSLAGWLACAAGSALAFLPRPAGAPGRPFGHQIGIVLTLTIVALGAAVAFAPSWDSYTLHTAAGASQYLTAGNAFANPAPVIAGNVAVMVALVAVVVVAALWHPIRLGAALLAGAIVPMAAQLVSALVLVGEAVSPAQFGISPAQAAQAGLTISSGLTPAFWIYCVFVVALIVIDAWLLMAPQPAAQALPQPGGAVRPDPAPYLPGPAS